MNNTPLLHTNENSPDTEIHLKQNGEKFQGDCLTAMRLMFSGIRLSGETCKELYGINDRRLRNCYSSCPNMVKRRWVFNERGKRKYVEYYIEKFTKPTKDEIVKNWGKLIQLELL